MNAKQLESIYAIIIMIYLSNLNSLHLKNGLVWKKGEGRNCTIEEVYNSHMVKEITRLDCN